MNEVIENLETRRSVRNYKPDMVPREVLDQIIEAGTYAPTGMGRQSPIIVAVTNRELRDKLSGWNAKIMGADSDPFYGAPVVLIVLADKSAPHLSLRRKSGYGKSHERCPRARCIQLLDPSGKGRI